MNSLYEISSNGQEENIEMQAEKKYFLVALFRVGFLSVAYLTADNLVRLRFLVRC